ncbi:MAG: hypothetical protein V1752_04940, partial [Candidatus Firestonebacteria bacterium]
MGCLKAVAVIFFAGLLFSGTISKEEYLEKVKTGSHMYKSALAAALSAKKQMEEQQLLSSPWAFTEFQHGVDKSPSLEAFMSGDTRAFNRLAFGFEQRTDLGLSARVSYEVQHYSLEGIEPIVIPLGGSTISLDFITTPKYYSDKLEAEVKLDLLRNSFGSEVRSQKQALSFKNEAVYYEKVYQAKQVLMQAETAYWELALSREAVKLHETLLDRAHQLNTWMQGKINLNLQDESDINQSKSEVQYRKLELKGALDAEKSAARVFNYLRGVEFKKVEETLDLPEEKDLESMLKTVHPEKRFDFLSLLKNLEAAKASAALKKEVLLPELYIGASASLNGQDADFTSAMSASFGTSKYVYGAGVNLKVPLDFPADTLSKAYEEEWKSLETYTEGKRFEIKMEWEELNRKLADVKERLALAVELERLQKNKADAEIERL